MVVVVVRSVPASVRGLLSRWLMQIETGVYVGHLSARVRVLMWTQIEERVKSGSAVLIYPESSEQGFGILMTGNSDYKVEDFEGLKMMKRLING